MTRPIRDGAGPSIPFLLASILWLAPAGCDRPTSGTPTPPGPRVAAEKAAPWAEGEGEAASRRGPRGGLRRVDLKPPAPQEPSPFRFAEIAKASGIDFVHVSGMTADKHFPTANGSGVAIFDYDGDGKLDLYFATGHAPARSGPPKKGPNRLYKNLGGGKFRDVTESSGLGFAGFCHGIVVGDIDNDGDPDVFLCNYGPNVLYLNNGDGTFRDVSHAGRDRPPRLVVRRGLPRLRQRRRPRPLRRQLRRLEAPRGRPASAATRRRTSGSTARPGRSGPIKHFLYRNNGDGTFTDVYDQFLVDADGQGPRPDRRPRLRRRRGRPQRRRQGRPLRRQRHEPQLPLPQQGRRHFEDATETSGAAFDEKGQAQSGMGVDAEDVDGDGLPELFVTNFANEYNTLYQNLGRRHVHRRRRRCFGLAADTHALGRLGLLAGRLRQRRLARLLRRQRPRRRQPQACSASRSTTRSPRCSTATSRQGQGRRFQLATRDAGPYFDAKHVGRGAAFGDLDDDGDIDIVVNHKDGPAALLRNDTPTATTAGSASSSSGPGATATPSAPGSRSRSAAGRSPASARGAAACSRPTTRACRSASGTAPEVEKLTVRWPSGRRHDPRGRQDQPGAPRSSRGSDRRAESRLATDAPSRGRATGSETPSEAGDVGAAPVRAASRLAVDRRVLAALAAGWRASPGPRPTPTRSGTEARRGVRGAGDFDRAEADLARLARLRPPTAARLAAPGQLAMARRAGRRGPRRPGPGPRRPPDGRPGPAPGGPARAAPRPLRRGRGLLPATAVELDPKLVQARRELIYIYGMQLRRPELNAQFRALSELTPLTFAEVFLWCLTRGVTWEPAEIVADPGAGSSRPTRTTAGPGSALAEGLRQLNRLDEAEAALAPLPEADPEARAVRVRIALDRGDDQRGRGPPGRRAGRPPRPRPAPGPVRPGPGRRRRRPSASSGSPTSRAPTSARPSSGSARPSR